MRGTCVALSLFVVGFSTFRENASAAAIDTETLLRDMTDLGRLAKLPDPAYTTKQFSSYDRKAKSPEEDWFANADSGQYLRVEETGSRKERVMMDVDGPGAIVRIWSANPEGNIRIYIDGQESPAIEAPMKDVLGGTFPGLPKPIASEASRGWNLYFPIPYAKHCKVTSDKGDFYYHVNYRTYEKGTEVKCFAPDDLKRLAARIDQVAQQLGSPMKVNEPPAGSTNAEFDLNLQPGEERVLRDLRGPGAIRKWWVVITGETPVPHSMAAATRGTVLMMEFDDEQTVASPLGDFFGTAPGLNAYESLPMGCGNPPDSPLEGAQTPYFWANWWMPFQKRAKVSVKNWSGQKMHLHGVFVLVPYEWDDRSLLFHAKWRIQRDIPTRPFIDWTHLDAAGKGRFVGGHLHIWNPVKSWWGEGDEKIYVDGEKFPSHFGTGTEDYYGYAWGSSERFVHAYHNQPRCDGPGSYGNTSVNRFHILDDIPFTTHFKFDMENWSWPEKVKMDRAAVSYWYARPGGTDAFKPITREDVKYEERPAYQVYRVHGVIEAESVPPPEITGGQITKQGADRPFSGEEFLRWTRPKLGDKMTLTFDSPADGKKHMLVHLVKARDYGQVQLYVNDSKAGDVIDGYDPHQVPSGEIDLGEFELKKGSNKLIVEIVGKNKDATDKHLFGLDYIRLK